MFGAFLDAHTYTHTRTHVHSEGRKIAQSDRTAAKRTPVSHSRLHTQLIAFPHNFVVACDEGEGRWFDQRKNTYIDVSDTKHESYARG